jgi:hypothetical protein
MENQISNAFQSSPPPAVKEVPDKRTIPLPIFIITLIATILVTIGTSYFLLNRIITKSADLKCKQQIDDVKKTSAPISPAAATKEEKKNEIEKITYELPSNWTKYLYDGDFKASDKGFSLYKGCTENNCLLFENKAYDNSKNQLMNLFSQGRIYGYFYISTVEDILGDKNKTISDTKFFDNIKRTLKVVNPAKKEEDCGPYMATTTPKEITFTKYKTAMQMSYAACKYANDSPDYKHEDYYLLLNDHQILVVNFSYDKNNPNLTSEINNFKLFLASIKL